MVGDSVDEVAGMKAVQLGSGRAGLGIYYIVHTGVIVDPDDDGGPFTPLPAGKYVRAQGSRVAGYVKSKYLVAEAEPTPPPPARRIPASHPSAEAGSPANPGVD